LPWCYRGITSLGGFDDHPKEVVHVDAVQRVLHGPAWSAAGAFQQYFHAR
jgi:hypothetical protein